ncbi:rCG42060 [Rattus norvegicus]|uniref:RCG42060 n=1 Tax=Rattus norvegicus TaxID=10116 RepID=A6JUN6_RAT|nr:rCG42060 [Rattus norvegicus]
MNISVLPYFIPRVAASQKLGSPRANTQDNVSLRRYPRSQPGLPFRWPTR